VTALTLVGEGLNDTLNPTLRRRKVRPPQIQSSAVGPASAPEVEGEVGR
jgi:peptide/nickel transport system permease protein